MLASLNRRKPIWYRKKNCSNHAANTITFSTFDQNCLCEDEEWGRGNLLLNAHRVIEIRSFNLRLPQSPWLLRKDMVKLPFTQIVELRRNLMEKSHRDQFSSELSFLSSKNSRSHRSWSYLYKIGLLFIEEGQSCLPRGLFPEIINPFCPKSA